MTIYSKMVDRLPILMLLSSILIFYLPQCLGNEEVTDFRFISYDDLLPGIERFSVEGVTSYTQLLFDIPRYQLLVGARDHLFRLTLEGLQKVEDAEWPATQHTIELCLVKGQSKEDCRNYVRVLLARSGRVFACGTNAFNPRCSWRNIDNLSRVIEDMNGIGMCPYSPMQNVTALIASSGDYYVGSTVDFSARDPAIYRFKGQRQDLRTVQYNQKWLSEPNFVGSFEIRNFTYFFFRETAVEYINCGKTVYSRVARVCQNDGGGQYLLKDNWTTFLKARLNCSVPGEYPFYYNDLQSVFYVEQENVFYASFTTPVNSILGSAVCAFNMTAIEKSFHGQFKFQKNPDAAWERQSGHSAAQRHFQCEKPSASGHLESERYQLMDEDIRPTTPSPLITQELERFSHIVVNIVPTKHHEAIHVLFIATMEGLIKKLMILPRTQETCLLEVFKLQPGNSSQPIRVMKILKDTSSLYIGTDNSVVRISVERCNRFTSKRACLNAMDPYCGWNSQLRVCAMAPERNPLSGLWQQDIPSCPVLTESVDGGWGPWSDWRDCSHLGHATPGGRCHCRTRQCNAPLPANGGQPCEGTDLQVTNCMRNGQWTEWSAWSACSQTCGLASKTRRRTCGNPEPAHGGRTCVGPDRDEIFCTMNPPCPVQSVVNVDGRWSEWGAWDECSVPCGGGFHMRRRRCDNPAPRHEGRDCSGCATEHRACNQHACIEARKATLWTPWLKGNVTRNGYYEVRFRFSCKANVPETKFIRVGHMKKEERFCLESGRNCISSEFLNNDGDWSHWSSWTDCSAGCGGGIQFRERYCDSPRPSGSGLDCLGERSQQRPCNTHPCSKDDGWEEWSSWTTCDATNNRHRTRKCSLPDPGCLGPGDQSQLCEKENSIETNAIPQSSSYSVSVLVPGHVIAGCIACFILGVILAGLICYYAWIKPERRRHDRGDKLFTNLTARPNIYVPPNDCVNKNNYKSGALTREGIPLTREASIKRNGHKINLDADRFE